MGLWYRWSFDNQEEKGEIKARVCAPAKSPWFDGHFPSAPVLPGIAQLGMVHDLLCRASGRWSPVDRLSRVRFKQIIRPDQELVVAISTEAVSGAHRFRICGDQGLICSGLIQLGTPGVSHSNHKD